MRRSQSQSVGLVDVAEAVQAANTEESSPLGNRDIIRRLTLPVGEQDRLVINPLVDSRQIGPTSIDLRLGTEWESMRTHRFDALDPGQDKDTVADLLEASIEEFRLTSGQRRGLVLHPGELLLALTLEYLALPQNLWGLLEGRSTWARMGLQVHATAGMIDCGFRGYLTLELQNMGRIPLVLYPGIRVAQISFFPVRGVLVPYSDKPGAAYSNQTRTRSAFTEQHEHRLRNEYVTREKQAELLRHDANR
jgi:dCTP deaminase